MGFRRFLRELLSTFTLIVLLLFLLLAARVAVVNPRLGLALAALVALYVLLMLAGAILKKARGALSREARRE
ncbi:MAG: hypothetical protein QXS85_04500 [Acidilobaceae archaeon]